MKKKRADQIMPFGSLTRVRDFLPPPRELVMPEETVKITIALKKSSVDFFKHQAKRYDAKYQRMIRAVLDRYASQYHAMTR